MAPWVGLAVDLLVFKNFQESGEPSRTRTGDNLLKREVL